MLFLYNEINKNLIKKFSLKKISKILKRKLMIHLNRINGRNNQGQISIYNRGGVIKRDIASLILKEGFLIF